MKDLSSCTVLIVDDTETNIDILVESLGEDYDLSVATDGASALDLVKQAEPDLILLDIMMPGMDGYEVCRKLQGDPRTADIPVIFLTALGEVKNKTLGFEIGGVDYITKPFEVTEIKARVKTQLSLLMARRELAAQNEILENRVRERTRELLRVRDATIRSLASLAECRDTDTGNHIWRTQKYIVRLAEWYRDHIPGGTDLDIEILGKSASLHDIGKVGVPDHILFKPGPLTTEEFNLMKNHTIKGWDTIRKAQEGLPTDNFLSYAEEIAYTHHEKWDGSGYPRGLKGTQIPLSGRLMAVADVYDALVSPRVYKKAMPHSEAVKTILAGGGSHFDPELVRGFGDISESFRQIALSLADSEEQKASLAV
jgi:putative two-component system response regulator